jgi:hypothetical protein
MEGLAMTKTTNAELTVNSSTKDLWEHFFETAGMAFKLLGWLMAIAAIVYIERTTHNDWLALLILPAKLIFAAAFFYVFVIRLFIYPTIFVERLRAEYPRSSRILDVAIGILMLAVIVGTWLALDATVEALAKVKCS